MARTVETRRRGDDARTRARGALDVPDDAARSTVEGTLVRDYVDGGRRVVTWERDGHTCVLTGPTRVKRQVMLDLAGWKGKGAVPF